MLNIQDLEKPQLPQFAVKFKYKQKSLDLPIHNNRDKLAFILCFFSDDILQFQLFLTVKYVKLVHHEK